MARAQPEAHRAAMTGTFELHRDLADTARFSHSRGQARRRQRATQPDRSRPQCGGASRPGKFAAALEPPPRVRRLIEVTDGNTQVSAET
jgi:hypothetical protein